MPAYTAADLHTLRDFYRDRLLNDTLPFWLPRSVDGEHGGYLLMRDRDGSLLDSDKAIWHQGRFAWLLATLFATVEPRPEWLEAARSGIGFLRRHGFDREGDGRMWFLVARDGAPLRKRRYFFSETFACLALAAYARASGEARAAEEAADLFGKILAFASGETALPPKWEPARRAKGIGVPMILINVAQQLRECLADPRADECIERCIAEIERDFVKDDLRCVMEQVAPDGAILDHFDGRTLNPGHAIEAAWFILEESRLRGGDARLTSLGARMLDYMWERGWDEEFGGILYFRDLDGKPVQEYWHDMKFWWPQNETILATLLAHLMTGEAKYADWHRQIHGYAHRLFPDPEHGEWFGYLHRDGRVSVPLKGNWWKGPFHLPRMQWKAAALIDALGPPE
ncbi:MAG: AGE family epimerase/isomerase [Verrucomicrobiales bacterium]